MKKIFNVQRCLKDFFRVKSTRPISERDQNPRLVFQLPNRVESKWCFCACALAPVLMEESSGSRGQQAFAGGMGIWCCFPHWSCLSLADARVDYKYYLLPGSLLMVCSNPSRPGRSTLTSGRWEKMLRAVGMLDMPLFTGGRATHATSCVPN